MRELSECEIDQVDGAGNLANNLTMGVASAWTSGIAGFAIGSVIPGVGSFAGLVVGVGLGIVGSVGYGLASYGGGGGGYRDTREGSPRDSGASR